MREEVKMITIGLFDFFFCVVQDLKNVPYGGARCVVICFMLSKPWLWRLLIGEGGVDSKNSWNCLLDVFVLLHIQSFTMIRGVLLVVISMLKSCSLWSYMLGN
jgi:hypothetical protein